MLGRLTISLAVVLGIVWLLARRVRKSGRGGGQGLIDVLGRQQLSRSASIAVVHVGDQALIVGVTDGQVSVLGQTDLAAALAAGTQPATRRTRSPRRTEASRLHLASAAPPAAHAHRASSARPAKDGAAQLPEPSPRSALAGSALSPQTWKQTLESLREMTAR